MTLHEFKQSDTYHCLTVTIQLLHSIGRVVYKLSRVFAKAVFWVAIKAYRYVSK